jgi:hypothetical protein
MTEEIALLDIEDFLSIADPGRPQLRATVNFAIMLHIINNNCNYNN